MTGTTVDVDTSPDGTLVIQPHGVLDAAYAVELRRALIHAVRRLRPLRLVLDLHDVADLDPISLGTLAAACQLGDDHHVAVFLDHSTPQIAEQLHAAGVPRHRLRHIGNDGRHLPRQPYPLQPVPPAS
jgi:anti-anti-sigma factor